MSTAVSERGSVQISKMELDSRHMELDEVSAPAELKVQGVGECSFLLANECELYCASAGPSRLLSSCRPTTCEH